MSLKGAVKGLAAVKAKAEQKQSFQGDGTSVFLTIKDGDSYKIRFLQEFDEGSKLYDERRGTVTVVEEHVSPKDFRKRAVCTYEEEGRCWACEQTSLPEIGKKWKARMRFYANVIVRGESGDKVKILAQGFGDKNIGTTLVGIAEEYENLGGQDFKLSRKGAGMNDTSYTLIPLAPKKLSAEDEKLEVVDVGKFINYVSYEQQANYFAGGDTQEAGGPGSW